MNQVFASMKREVPKRIYQQVKREATRLGILEEDTEALARASRDHITDMALDFWCTQEMSMH